MHGTWETVGVTHDQAWSGGAMTAVVRGIVWLGILIGICVAPLAFSLMSTDVGGLGRSSEPGRNVTARP
jgi:hypothetical protein